MPALPDDEQRKTIMYYSEMIDDRIEDGMTEEEAVAALGPMGAIIGDIISDMSVVTAIQTRINSEKKKKNRKKPSGLVIALLIIGSPIWFSLAIAAACVVFALVITVLALAFSFIVVVLSFFLSALLGVVSGVLRIANGMYAAGLCTIGLSFIFAGGAMLLIRPAFTFKRFVINRIRSFKIKKSVILGNDSREDM